MTLDEIRSFVAAAQRHGMTEALFRQGSQSLRVSGLIPVGDRAGALEVAADPAVQDPTVKADRVGVLRLRHPSGLGDVPGSRRSFEAGHRLAYIEAGSILHPVLAPIDGTIGEMLAADGDVVGYGTPLLRYSPSNRRGGSEGEGEWKVAPAT